MAHYRRFLGGYPWTFLSKTVGFLFAPKIYFFPLSFVLESFEYVVFICYVVLVTLCVFQTIRSPVSVHVKEVSKCYLSGTKCRASAFTEQGIQCMWFLPRSARCHILTTTWLRPRGGWGCKTQRPCRPPCTTSSHLCTWRKECCPDRHGNPTGEKINQIFSNGVKFAYYWFKWWSGVLHWGVRPPKKIKFKRKTKTQEKIE